ncbi:MAG TPA: hypothetical protein VG206_18900 [Terriglobia bacterium]|nr:hypothetical protein [Terriglobia bacterium]
MKSRNRRPIIRRFGIRRLALVAAALGIFMGFGIVMFGREPGVRKQDPAQNHQATAQPAPVDDVVRHNMENWILQGRGIPDDWTHHHLVFSNPGTEEQAIENGTHDRWLRIVNDPRYIMQQLKRRAGAGVLQAEGVAAAVEATGAQGATGSPNAAGAEKAIGDLPAANAHKQKIKKDWSTGLDGAAASQTGTVSSNGATGTSTVTVDGQTFTGSAPTPASASGSFSSRASSGTTLTIKNGSNTLTLTAGSSNGTCSGSSPWSVGFNRGSSGSGNSSTWASGIATVLTSGTQCSTNIGVTATANSPSNGDLTITDSTAGTGGNSGITLTWSGTSNFTPAWSSTNLSGGADGTTSGTSFAYWSVNAPVSTSQLATNIATAIDDNTTLQGSAGVTASSSSNVVAVTARATGTSGNSIGTTASLTGFAWGGTKLTGGATGTGRVQPNTYPAKYGVSLTGASCSDFAVYPTGQAGGTGAANIIGYDNLYTGGCAGAVPSVYWAYNTGGTVTTSPVLFEDGLQVAYIQSNGTTASLVLLKWAASTTETLGAPLTLTSQSSASAYRSCIAPCMYTLAFANGADDTLSAPYDSYNHDTIYVGDDGGNLHQFTGVFNGNSAESGSPWPVHLGANKLASPVYDCDCGFQGGYVFVGDMGGVFYSVGTSYSYEGTNGVVHGNTGSLGDAIADAPLVDSSEGTELVFVTTNGSYSYTGYNGVWEFVSIFTTLGTPGVVPVGCGSSTTCGGTVGGYYLYASDYDNVYYESGNPAYGHLYVVGNTGVAGGGTLYQVEIAYSSLVSGGVTAVATGLNSTEHPWPSPLTEFCNNGTSACAITQQRTVTGSVNTSGTVTITSGTFTTADVGAVLVGTGIPFGDTISTYVSSSKVDLTTAPSSSVPSETLSILGGQTTSGTDYVFFSVNRGTPSGCTNSAGDGCILSYNVNNLTAVALSGSGLNVTTPGTNGCWATGGLIIDNSDTVTTGASQIYFLNLNGNAAGGPTGSTQTSTNCTGASGSSPINAVQASQSNP